MNCTCYRGRSDVLKNAIILVLAGHWSNSPYGIRDIIKILRHMAWVLQVLIYYNNPLSYGYCIWDFYIFLDCEHFFSIDSYLTPRLYLYL